MSTQPPPAAPLPTAPPAGRTLRLSRRAKIALLAVGVAFGVGAALFLRCGLFGCPDVDRLTSYQPGRAPVLLDRHGHAFADLAPVEAETVPLREMPRHVREAFLAVEDRRFYKHHGVDWRRVGGALLKNLRSGGYEEGFSTLTMQLARNVFPERLPFRQRTLFRKLLEVRVAFGIEDEYSKDEILELYLNHIYFGNGARGLQAASRHYFGVPAPRLDLAQAALLAALPKGPSLYDPRRHPKEARRRRDLVLTLMAEQGRIPRARAEDAKKQRIKIVRARPVRSSPGLAPHFVEEVRRQLEELMGEALYDETLRIHTTLDAEGQRAAEEELSRQLRAIEGGALGRFRGPAYSSAFETANGGTPYLQGALVAVDVKSGNVLAWVGGRDFNHSRFDRVRAGYRQAGSAFKPFVYAAALSAGRTLSQRLSDQPLRVSLGGRRYWEPKNFDGAYEGEVTLREALVRSKNVATVRLAESVGFEAVADIAHRAGLQGEISTRPSMALGTAAVSPLEMVSAFTVFASLGEAVRPRVLLRIERANGKALWAADPPERRSVLEEGPAFLVTDALREALARGTGAVVRASGFGGPAAGKTGTTNDGTDAWFVGYTPDVTAAVWVGFDRPRPIVPRATGGRLAAPVWARFMMRLYRRRPMPGPWPLPSSVVRARVDPASGFLLAEGCEPFEPPRTEYFLRGTLPATVCPYQVPPPWAEAMAGLPPLPDDEEGGLTFELPEDDEGENTRRRREDDEEADEDEPRRLAPPSPEVTPEAPSTPPPETATPEPEPDRHAALRAGPRWHASCTCSRHEPARCLSRLPPVPGAEQAASWRMPRLRVRSLRRAPARAEPFRPRPLRW